MTWTACPLGTQASIFCRTPARPGCVALVAVGEYLSDATVVNALIAMRPHNAFGVSNRVRIRWPGGAAPARVTAVSSVTTSALACEATITSDIVSEDGR